MMAMDGFRIQEFYKRFPILLWLILLFAALGSVVDIIEYYSNLPSRVFNILCIVAVAVSKATVLTGLYVFSKRFNWLYYLTIAVIIVFILLSLVNGLSTLLYGFGISRKMLTILAETNVGEVHEFLPGLAVRFKEMLFSWKTFCVLLGGVVFVCAVIAVPKRLFCMLVVGISFVGIGYFGYVSLTSSWGRTNYIVCMRTYRSVSGVLRNMSKVRELKAVPRVFPDAESLSSAHLIDKLVVVIGESASRDHLAVYGYPLPTTPELEARSSDLILFNNAVASSTSTAENMPRLLSFMTDEPTEKEWYDYPTVIQVARLSGYRTYWLSNQERTGEWSNLSGILSMDADVVKYVGAEDSEDHLLSKYDEVLLPILSDAIVADDSLQVIFLHLMGSHILYENRVPPSMYKFKYDDILKTTPREWLDKRSAGVVAAYDNSILYTDSILGVVMDMVDSVGKPAVMVYLSDHGENVYDDRKYNGRDPKFTEVPFIIYMNALCRNANPILAEEMRDARSRKFSTSELPQMIMHLTGTRHALYDSVRDPLSSFFRERPRYVDGKPFGSE